MSPQVCALILGVIIFFVFSFLGAPVWLALGLGAFVVVSTIMAGEK